MVELENNELDVVEASLKKASSSGEQDANQNNSEVANAFIDSNDKDDDINAINAANGVIGSIEKESIGATSTAAANPPAAKTPDRRKIAIKFIQNKTKRHVTFSKRKHGIMKKAYELSVLTGTQVLLLVVSETGLVYTFTTPKFQPIVTEPEGKNLIQTCLNTPDGEEEEEDEDDDDEEGNNNNDKNNNNGGAEDDEGEENGDEEEEDDEDDRDKNNNNAGSNSSHYHNQSNIDSNEQFSSNIVGDLALDAADDVHQSKRLKLNDGSFQRPETLIV